MRLLLRFLRNADLQHAEYQSNQADSGACHISCARAGNRRLDGCDVLQSRLRGHRGHKRDDDGGSQAACNRVDAPGVHRHVRQGLTCRLGGA